MSASETHINMFGGSPLNRLSWLRPSQQFLNAIIEAPNAKWVVFNAGQPLLFSGASKPTPALLSTADIKSVLGDTPYFGQGEKEGELLAEKDGEDNTHPQHSPTESARHRGIPITFLGLHEPSTEDSSLALPSSEFSDPKSAIEKLKGTPYFTVDLADLDYSEEQLNDFLKTTSFSKEGKPLAWSEPRALMTNLDLFTAAIFAEARSMADWNLRNKYCPGCGTKAYSMWGGWKIACRSLLPWADNTNKKPCPTTRGLHNFTHPRTDGVVIMIAIDETGEKILLGRGRKFPGNFYSALAGFIEPGESFEDAVSREMWEEAGVKVWNVKYHSGQPWPYPANIMVGFYARADSTKPIRVDLDNELVDAKWFTREEVAAVLNHRIGTRFDNTDHKKMTEHLEGRPVNATDPSNLGQAFSNDDKPVQPKEAVVEEPKKDEPPFKVPPTTAIAGVLIRDWVEGRISFPPENPPIPNRKGNL
ncbi:NAD+ diphosphatase [Panaeolus papilionaceus]|nr:NAD+ diphosphatase [Panaeolus papilionaceus]